MTLHDYILRIPTGYSEVLYQGRRYALTRTERADGRSLAVFARELGGTDYISFNYYRMKARGQLKPCEMPEEKVVDFLENHEQIYESF